MKVYTSVAKRVKTKSQKVLGVIRTFVEVTGEKTSRGGEGGEGKSPILNRVNICLVATCDFNLINSI